MRVSGRQLDVFCVEAPHGTQAFGWAAISFTFLMGGGHG